MRRFGRKTKLIIVVAAAVVVIGAIVGAVVYAKSVGDTGVVVPKTPPIPITAPSPISGEQLLAKELDSPTALALLPDGRIVITQQAGDVRLVDSSGLQAAPLFSVVTNANDEEGLDAIAVDPHFADNGFLYVSYTAQTPHHHQRLSRFTMQGSTVAASSEKVLLDLSDNDKPYHLGGALTFMTDGTLLMGTGEHVGSDPQSLDSLAGKVLRINADGSIPSDNPFFNDKKGDLRAIWAYGFRNPYSMATDKTGRVLESDVGEDTYEEINQVERGNNYGWPKSEGPTTQQGQTTPAFAYDRTGGCAIIGGSFTAAGDYLFMDYCKGTIRSFNPDTKAVTDVGVITGEGPSGIVASGANFFYLERGLVYLDGGTGQGFNQGALYERAL